jgi:hypothetical protein
VFIVLSEPPAELPAEEFDRFYTTHVRQILELPAFAAAERFSLRFVRGTSDEPPQFSHYVRYEIDGEFDEAWRQLRAAVDNGRMEIPSWFPQVHTEGWHGTSIGGRVEARAPAATR